MATSDYLLLLQQANREGRPFDEVLAEYNALDQDDKDALLGQLSIESAADELGDEPDDFLVADEQGRTQVTESEFEELLAERQTEAAGRLAAEEARRSAQIREDERKATINNESPFERAARADAALGETEEDDDGLTPEQRRIRRLLQRDVTPAGGDDLVLPELQFDLSTGESSFQTRGQSALIDSFFDPAADVPGNKLLTFPEQLRNLVTTTDVNDTIGATAVSGGAAEGTDAFQQLVQDIAAEKFAEDTTRSIAQVVAEAEQEARSRGSRLDFAGVTTTVSTTYQDVAYVDRLSNVVPAEKPESLIKLPGERIVRYAEGSREEDEGPVFLMDALVWIQGVEVSEFIQGDISISLSGTGGNNTASFTLDNANDQFLWTERNLFTIYGETAARARAPYIEELRKRFGEEAETLANPDVQELTGLTPEFVEAVRRISFTQQEHIKEEIFNYKANPRRNPPIRNPKNTLGFARYDLVPGRCIFNRMDPVRIFSLYPFRVPGKRYEGEDGRPELWVPEFTGYIENVSIDDDNLTGKSAITIDCVDIRQAVLRRMRLSNDMTSGLTAQLDALGFSIRQQTFTGDTSSQTSQQQTIQSQFKDNTQGFYDIDNTLFYDDIITTIFNQPFPNKSLEGALREVLVAKEPITTERNNRGVRGVTFGGNFFYDALNWSQAEVRSFMESWHKFTLFGPKRRPWTREEVDAVGRGTTTDGTYAPNKIRLWFLLPRGGSGPKNLADLSTVSVNLNHDVNWTNRQEIIDNFAESIDYNFMVAPSGDLVCEFTMADFRPEDFGEFRDNFRIDKGLISSQFGDEQTVPPAGLIVTRGMAAAAGVPPELAQTKWTRTFVYSPYIAARYGIEIEQDSIPFLQATDKVLAQQRSVLMFQRKLAQAHALNMTFSYRPWILPNRPLHHMPRTRIGSVVTTDKTIALGPNPKGSVSAGLEHVRMFTGHYRSPQDFTKLNEKQRKDLATKGINPDDTTRLAGPDSVQSADSVELQVYTNVASGESTPTSARVPWGPLPDDPDAISVLAPASGIYVLDLDKTRPPPPERSVEPVDEVNADDVGRTALEGGVDENGQYKFAANPVADPAGTIIAPLKSGFGSRRITRGGQQVGSGNHTGLDFGLTVGTDVYAAEPGVFIRAQQQQAPGHPGSGNDNQPGKAGNIILLRTDSGFLLQYLHLDPSTRELGFNFGDRVEAGTLIGKSGETGTGTGPHLHFEVIAKKSAVEADRAKKQGKIDPAPFLPGLNSEGEA